MSIALSVNLNKIALIRNSREGNYPDLIEHAKACISHGANGITVHPRPDQRHVRPGDVLQLAELLKPLPEIEFNVEGNPFAAQRGDYPGLTSLAEAALPDQCTLVPDTDHQLTSDHGFDLTKTADKLLPVIEKLKSLKIRVSLFMDPIPEQIELAKQLGADRIELYTGPYAAAWNNDPDTVENLYQQHRRAALLASELGLGVNAGHDLNLGNLPMFSTIPGLKEVSIGHALIVDAITLGLAETVKAYKAILEVAATTRDGR
ncbi:pyridoxine 5'-phosphate synthase [Porticoccus sp.]|uniref:pyridoxine 5'-phosphate synthase n=1 Tax=Porticoccus sp. TaxID=2024853 RepID=UPI000C667670|nr:pyridoxine 5'-phosphate synthase [Porticoccus sp.]MAZ70328.1 pyridoxine 5'-phosphate synthase [Porticoccus sp.]|tara:strand:- start:43071 stop:43853 length:783 start_codon:yes stop_codon:yes gene_type:complete